MAGIPPPNTPTLTAHGIGAHWGSPLKCPRRLYDDAHGRVQAPPPMLSPATLAHPARGHAFEAELVATLQEGKPIDLTISGVSFVS